MTKITHEEFLCLLDIYVLFICVVTPVPLHSQSYCHIPADDVAPVCPGGSVRGGRCPLAQRLARYS